MQDVFTRDLNGKFFDCAARKKNQFFSLPDVGILRIISSANKIELLSSRPPQTQDINVDNFSQNCTYSEMNSQRTDWTAGICPQILDLPHSPMPVSCKSR